MHHLGKLLALFLCLFVDPSALQKSKPYRIQYP